MKQGLLSTSANTLAWLGAFFASWAIYAQFDTQTVRAGIYAAAVTLTAMLQILFWTQKGELLCKLRLRESILLLMSAIGFVALKGYIDLLFAGYTSVSAANIQAALNKNSPWGILLTIILAVIFVTGFALTTLRLSLRKMFGLDSGTERS